MPANSEKQRTCSECGGADIVMGVAVTKSAEAGKIGLAYHAFSILRGTAPLYADLCRQCGTVVRLFVKETDKPWIQDS